MLYYDFCLILEAYLKIYIVSFPVYNDSQNVCTVWIETPKPDKGAAL